MFQGMPSGRGLNKNQWLVLGVGAMIAMIATFFIMYMVSMPYVGHAVLVLLLFCGVVALGAMYVGSLMWVYHDAKQRGRSPEIVLILVALCAWPLSVLFWRLARPEVEIGGVKIVLPKKTDRMQ